MNKNIYLIITFFIFSILFCTNTLKFSDESYVTDEYGIIRMNVNIMGHVTNPGTYLAYDGIDIMSMLSMAGGYKQGSDLRSIIIYSKNGNKKIINLKGYLSSEKSDNNKIEILPYDTIYIKEKPISRFFLSTNLPSIILSFINVAITLSRE